MTITIFNLFAILVGHYIGDFLLQTDYMATNKSKSEGALTLHVLAYGVGLLVTVLMLTLGSSFNGPTISSTQYQNLFFWIIFNMMFHFCQDYVTSRLSSYYHKKGNTSAFFNVIGFDQATHVFLLCFFLYTIVISK